MILALDTATEAFSVAIKRLDNSIIEHTQMAPRLHSKLILGTIEQLLKDNNLSKNDITAIVFGKGPGSFTGVRIAVSVAQGLSIGLAVPIIGISTLASMAQYQYRLSNKKHFACAIDARMNEVYWAEYQINNGLACLIHDESVISPRSVSLSSKNNNYIGVGSGWVSYKEPLEKALIDYKLLETIELFPNAYDMIALAEDALKNNASGDVLNAEPTYLRNKVAKTIKEREQAQ